MDMEDTWTASGDARAATLTTLGELGEHYAPLINPMLMGGPAWPCRPGYQAVKLAKGGMLMATNGLSDAWEDEPEGVGLGMEVYAAASEIPEDPGQSWLLSIVRQLGNVCAGHGGVRGLLEEIGALTVELENEGFPEEALLENGRVCVLLGSKGPLANVALPNGEVRYACATLLTPAQTADVLANGDARRAELAAEISWKSGPTPA